jgi:uncharacterized protein YodC (DUF2158 family)
MAEQFKVGDVVLLKSGGPDMTIETVTGQTVHCVWFEKNVVKRGAFPMATLEAKKPWEPVIA